MEDERLKRLKILGTRGVPGANVWASGLVFKAPTELYYRDLPSCGSSSITAMEEAESKKGASRDNREA